MNSFQDLTPAQRLAKAQRNKSKRANKSARQIAVKLAEDNRLAEEAEAARIALIPPPNKRERRAKVKADAEQVRLDAEALIEANRLQAIAVIRQKKKDDKKAKQAAVLQLQLQEAEDERQRVMIKVSLDLKVPSKVDLNKLNPAQLLAFALKQVEDAKQPRPTIEEKEREEKVQDPKLPEVLLVPHRKHQRPSKLLRATKKQALKARVHAQSFEEEARQVGEQEFEVPEPEPQAQGLSIPLTQSQQYALLDSPEARRLFVQNHISHFPQTAEPQSYLIQTAYFNHHHIPNATTQTILYQFQNFPFVARQQIEITTHYDLLTIFKQRVQPHIARSRPIEMFQRDPLFPNQVISSGDTTTLRFDTLIELLCPSFDYYQKIEEVKYLLQKIALGYVDSFRSEIAIIELASIKLNVANKVLSEQDSFLFQGARSHAVNRIFHTHTVYEDYDYETFKTKSISDFFGVNLEKVIAGQEGGCVIKAILLKFEKLWNDYYYGKEKRKTLLPRLTFDFLAKLFNTTAATSHSVSIQQAIELFFKPYNLTIRVFDRFNRIIAAYAPGRHRHITDQLEVCFANEHFYVLNHNIESLIQLTLPTATVKDWITSPSSEYPQAVMKPHKIYTMTKMQEFTSFDYTDLQNYTVITQMNIEHVLDYMRYNLQYTPGIIVDKHNNITGIKTKVGENVITIRNDQNLPFSDVGFNPTDETTLTPAQQLQAFEVAHYTACAALMNDETLSHYEENFVHNSRLTKPKAVNNVISFDNPKPTHTMDKIKCYPSAFYKLEHLPRVNVFDKYRPYNDEKIVHQHFYTLQVHTHPPQHLIPLLNQYQITYPGFILLTPIKAPLTQAISHPQYKRHQLLRQEIDALELQIYHLSETYPLPQDQLLPKQLLETRIKAVNNKLDPPCKKKNLLFYLKPYVNIIAYCTVPHITPGNKRVKSIIKAIFTSTKLTHHQAKNAVNFAIGKTVKTKHKTHIGLIVDTQAEAINYAQQLGGTAYPYTEIAFPLETNPLRYDPTAPLQDYATLRLAEINNAQMVDPIFSEEAQLLCDIDYGIPYHAPSKRADNEYGAHTVQRNYSTPLTTGYLPLDMYGKAMYRLELFKDQQEVYNITGTPYSYRTDGIDFNTTYPIKLILKNKSWAAFGKHTIYPFKGKLQTKLISTLPLPDQPQLIFTNPPPIQFQSPMQEEHYKTSPYYQHHLNEMFHTRIFTPLNSLHKVQGPLVLSSTNRILVEAATAGVGKTYAIILYIILISTLYPHLRILVSAPTNQRLLALRKDLQHLPNIDFHTCHKILGLRMEEQQDERQEKTGALVCKKARKKLDLQQYFLLFIDEVYILPSMNLSLLDSAFKKAPYLNVILTGDHLQQTILDINLPDPSTYMLNAVRSMCNTGIQLRKQKRLQDPQQQKNLITIKNMLLQKDSPRKAILKSICNMLGYTVSKLTQVDDIFAQYPNAKGICYYQSLRRFLNQREQDRRITLMQPMKLGLDNKCWMQVGTKFQLYGGNMLKCKQRMNASAYSFHMNETVQFIGVRVIDEKQYAIFAPCPFRVQAEANRHLAKLKADAKAKGKTYIAPPECHSTQDPAYRAKQLAIKEVEKKEKVVKVPIDYFNSNDYFEFTYYDTCIQTQGDSYDSPMILFNTKDDGLTPQGVYTTIARATDLTNVHCFIEELLFDDDGNKISELGDDYSESIIRTTIAKHIAGHKSADKKAYKEGKRQAYIENGLNYIDEDYAYNVLYMQQRYCIHCRKDLHVRSFSSRDRFSIDRINDNVAHIKRNCAASCLRCNNARRMKTHPPTLY